MTVLVNNGKMLYCPKCQEIYEEGSQRFCNNDGGRLLPVSNAEKAGVKAGSAGGGVFTNLLSRSVVDQERDEKLAQIPRFTKADPEPAPVQEITSIFESDADEIELELDAPMPSFDRFVEPAVDPADAPTVELPSDLPATWAESQNIQFEASEETIEEDTATLEESLIARPVGRMVRPEEIPSGTAEPGNRQINPVGRTALSWDNTDVMIGQTIKGRYRIVQETDRDESSISFLAEDRIVSGRKAIVRILMDEDDNDEFTNKVYAEERVTFSHINHPNVVGIIDSGELQEGNSFVITEYVDGNSIKDLLARTGQFDIARTARIIRQASYALSEVHQNGVLHRNLKPGNIILTFPGTGTEQVKINGFCTSRARVAEEELAYKAPEVLEGQVATYASDVFSLAVIAYEMLTRRLPFSGSNKKQMLRSQREGMLANLFAVRSDAPPLADKILEKAMAANPIDRYPKARDFGDAFFNAMTTVAPWHEAEEDSRNYQVLKPLVPTGPLTIPIPLAPLPEVEEEIAPVAEDVYEIPDADVIEAVPVAESAPIPVPAVAPIVPIAPAPEHVTDDPQWTKRSPEPPKTTSPNWIVFAALGFVVLLGGIWAIWSYWLTRPPQPAYVPPATTTNQNAKEGPPITDSRDATNSPATEAGEVPPPDRKIAQPPNTTFFQANKSNMKGDLARNFVPFSVYYPNDWKVNEAAEGESGNRGKFLDISRNASNGKLAEQMLISYYESLGTINSDADKFPQLVKETNETLKKLIPDYQMLTEGRKDINGWLGYEVTFQGGGTDPKTGEKLIVWGRRLFIPAARPGVKNGFEITMLATSYAADVKSVDDVGNKGGLATVLSTFEPGKNY